MKYVLSVSFSEPAEVLLPKVPDELSIHVARMREFHQRGKLLMSGPLRDPGQPLSTMGVFTAREAAEEFADGDPFIANGMAETWSIREWNELLPEPPVAARPEATRLPMKYVLAFDTRYRSMDEAMATAPDDIRAHIVRTIDLHERGLVLMAGAFCDSTEGLRTMCILPTREAAEEFAAGDPFVLKGMVSQWRIHEWNDVLGDRPGAHTSHNYHVVGP